MPHWTVAPFAETKMGEGANIVVCHGKSKPVAAIRGEWIRSLPACAQDLLDRRRLVLTMRLHWEAFATNA